MEKYMKTQHSNSNTDRHYTGWFGFYGNLQTKMEKSVPGKEIDKVETGRKLRDWIFYSEDKCFNE